MDIVTGILQGALIYAVPLWLAAMGELIEQRAGILGIGIEGGMLLGAFAGYFIALKTGAIWIGMLGGLVTGASCGIFVALFAVILGRSQIVTGLGVNILAAGITSFLFVELVTNVYNLVPYVDLMGILTVPVLNRIPIIGPVFFECTVITYIVYCVFALLAIVLYKTSMGLRIRAVGESAEKCNTLGVDVTVTKTISVVTAYTLVGLSGAALVLGAAGTFTHGMTVGRGFLAISIVIVSNWTLVGVAVIGFLFGITQSGQQILQIFFPQIPWQLLLAVPYIFGIIALVVGALKAHQPGELGVPFIRQK